MPDYAIIGDVSSSLTAILTDALSTLMPAQPPLARLHDLLGNIPTDPPILTVFLYEIVQARERRLRGHQRAQRVSQEIGRAHV